MPATLFSRGSDFWDIQFGLDLHVIVIQESLKHWINDLLLPMFFFVVGLEIKHEFVNGQLSSPRQAALPVVTAMGGMLVPIAVYLAFNVDGGAVEGWRGRLRRISPLRW